MALPLFFGKFRAKVIDVNDPEQRGRVRVMCPKVLGTSKSPWCEVCVPVAGDYEGDFCLPKVGEAVWVEFEDGKPNKPILVGGWYGASKSPKQDYSDAANERIISFKGSKISMRSGQCTISVGNSSITLTSNSIKLSSNGSSITLDSSTINKLKELV